MCSTGHSRHSSHKTFQRHSSYYRHSSLSSLSRHSSCSRDIPDAPETFQTFQSFMTLQPFQAILQILQCSSISRESTQFQHSPIRMNILHILQFDWFPENSTEYQLGNYRTLQTLHSSKKGRCCDIGQTCIGKRCQDDIFPRIELNPSFVLSSDNTNCKNNIQ